MRLKEKSWRVSMMRRRSNGRRRKRSCKLRLKG